MKPEDLAAKTARDCVHHATVCEHCVKEAIEEAIEAKNAERVFKTDFEYIVATFLQAGVPAKIGEVDALLSWSEKERAEQGEAHLYEGEQAIRLGHDVVLVFDRDGRFSRVIDYEYNDFSPRIDGGTT